MSPPRMARPSALRPATTASLRVPTPAMAPTPSARQAKKTRNPPGSAAQLAPAPVAAPGRTRSSAALPTIFGDVAVDQPDDAPATLHQVRLVGDEDERRVATRVQIEEDTHDRLLLWRRPGCPFGSSASRMAGSATKARARANPLLLAPRELSRIVHEPGAEADRFELDAGALKGVGGAGKFEGHGDVLQRRHGRHQMEILEDDADVVAAGTAPARPRRGPRSRCRRR